MTGTSLSEATPPKMLLGPLSAEQRTAIMAHASALAPDGRRTFRRLLVLAQERGLNAGVIDRAATQASEHASR